MSISAIVVAADPAWAARGKALASHLREHLGPLAIRVEHIGSTAIPAMPAKDLLDMQVSVSDLERATLAFTEPLAALGFVRTAYDNDHVPAGSDDDPASWTKRLFVRRQHLRRLQQVLAERAADRASYTEVKDPVVDLVFA